MLYSVREECFVVCGEPQSQVLVKLCRKEKLRDALLMLANKLETVLSNGSISENLASSLPQSSHNSLLLVLHEIFVCVLVKINCIAKIEIIIMNSLL